MKKIQLKKGIDLYLNKDGKFKTYMASVIFYRPLTREGASYGSLLTGMLKMGNRLCRTNRELNIELDKLYGAWMGCSPPKPSAMSFCPLPFLTGRWSFCSPRPLRAEWTENLTPTR